MLGRHQVPARVVMSPHQVSGRLLLDAGNGHLDDFAQMQLTQGTRSAANVGIGSADNQS